MAVTPHCPHKAMIDRGTKNTADVTQGGVEPVMQCTVMHRATYLCGGAFLEPSRTSSSAAQYPSRGSIGTVTHQP